MKELEYFDIINKTLSDVSLLGDDCAYLKDFDLCITQDSLVENVHFSLKTTDAYTLGQKAVNVNLSDLAAAGAVPLFVTISLSLPKNKDIDFVKDFYKGVEKSVSKYGVTVAGGDLTDADKVAFMEEIQMLYLDSKKRAKKFTPKKYRKHDKGDRA